MSAPLKNSDSPWQEWPLDREIVLSRVIDAPRSVVYAAWTDPDQIQQWFGPAGMAIETKEIDLNPSGVWRFDLVARDGIDDRAGDVELERGGVAGDAIGPVVVETAFHERGIVLIDRIVFVARQEHAGQHRLRGFVLRTCTEVAERRPFERDLDW